MILLPFTCDSARIHPHVQLTQPTRPHTKTVSGNKTKRQLLYSSPLNYLRFPLQDQNWFHVTSCNYTPSTVDFLRKQNCVRNGVHLVSKNVWNSSWAYIHQNVVLKVETKSVPGISPYKQQVPLIVNLLKSSIWQIMTFKLFISNSLKRQYQLPK